MLTRDTTTLNPSSPMTIEPELQRSEVIASAEDLRLVEALRRGDETAFVSLVSRYHASMLRLARLFVPDPALAEEVVQEAWIGVLRGLDRFEGRASLKTWIFRILTNGAKTRGQRENRSIPFSRLSDAGDESDEASVDPERFLPPDHPRWPNEWETNPTNWGGFPEDRLLARETLSMTRQAIERLPSGQRQVITLRDVEGWSSQDVCNILGISQSNQRVLLHRARSKVRRALERYFDGE
jgi:RNA polymerase sigma-70 factor (ECF subfamily)